MAEAIASTVTALLAAGAAAFSLFGFTSLSPQVIGPLTGAFFVLAFLVALLLIQPSRIWREQEGTIAELRLEIDALRESQLPRLEMTIDRPRESPGGSGIFLRLEVKNTGHQAAAGCYGKLLSVEGAQVDKRRLPEPGQNLVWSSRGGGQGQVTTSIAPDSSEFLDVAVTLKDEDVFHFVFPDWRSWALPRGDYTLTVEVGAQTVGVPTRRTYHLAYGGEFGATFRLVQEPNRS